MKVFPTRCDGQLSRIISIIVLLLKIIGLAPFSLQHTNNSTRNSRNNCTADLFLFSKIGLAYNILLSLSVLVVGAFSLPAMSSMSYPNKSSLTQAIDISVGILRTMTISVIIVSAALKQREAISIMNRLVEVDCLLSGMKKYPSMKRSSFTFVAVQMILNAVIWVIYWASEQMYIKSFLHWFIFNVPMFILNFFVVEYSIILGVVAREFESLNNHLLNFEEFRNYSFRIPVLSDSNLSASSSPMHCSQLSTLELLHKIRTTLSEVSQDIADFFSLPILPTVACFALTLVYNFWFLITPIVITSDKVLSSDINATTWILACVYPLVLLAFNIMGTLKQANLTGLIVHKLLARARAQEIQTELERFSLQLIHENLSFTAYGFVTLDFTLIQSIFGITATYLVIIIQFMQSAANDSKNTCS